MYDFKEEKTTINVVNEPVKEEKKKQKKKKTERKVFKKFLSKKSDGVDSICVDAVFVPRNDKISQSPYFCVEFILSSQDTASLYLYGSGDKSIAEAKKQLALLKKAVKRAEKMFAKGEDFLKTNK